MLLLLLSPPSHAAAKDDWLHLPQTVAPTGDYTAAERERLRASDPGVDGSPTSIVDSHFVRDLLANGAKPAPFAPAMEPEEWSEAVGVKLTDAKVRTIHGADIVATEAGLQPALQTEYFAAWELEDRPRRICLLTMDMTEDYRPYVGYLNDNIAALQSTFRSKGLPVFTSNWIRRPDDGLYGALDRFYGSAGVRSRENPTYIYLENGTLPMKEIAPTGEEIAAGLTIKSSHLSKFADVDSHGRSTFLLKLRALGVDTLVIVGAWSEDCVAATAFDAVDKYNLDTVVVEDAIGTATPTHFPAIEVMRAAVAKVVSTAQLVAYVDKLPPLAPEVRSQALLRAAAVRDCDPAAAGSARCGEGGGEGGGEERATVVPLPTALLLLAATAAASAVATRKLAGGGRRGGAGGALGEPMLGEGGERV